MRPHHERAIQKLTDHVSRLDDHLALIVGGSIAKGLEREDSDIDVMLVVSDGLYREKWETNQLCYFSVEFCDYPGGYVDGKYVDFDYIRQVAERGNEVARAAFSGAFVAFSRLPGLEELVRSIPTYQPQEKRSKVQSFYAQLEIAHWYVGEALRRDDKYLLTHSVADLVLFGSRLILAHNEVLYPHNKFLLTELERCAEKPEGLMDLTADLLERPGLETARAFYQAVKDFRFWNEAMELPAVRYMKDSELSWLTRTSYVGDL